MPTVTKLEQNEKKAQDYLNKILGTRYTWWRSGIVPERGPAWGRNGAPPSPAEVKAEGCFCAGVATLARRAVGLPVPTLGNANYDGGVVAYFGSTNAAPPDFPRQGYFEKHGRQRPFNLEKARRPWTLIGRKYRNVKDQGHVAIVIPGGKVLQSYDDKDGRPGVNDDVTLEGSHTNDYYEVMVYAEDWLLPFDYKEPRDNEEPPKDRPRPDQTDEQPDRPKRDRPEPDRPERDEKEREVPLFTARQLIDISGNPNLKPATAETYRGALIPEMRKAGITTTLRMAAFLGNVMVETDRLNTLEEYGSEAYFRYGPDSGDGLYLGDQWRYHGRGFLMNTWRDAYANLSKVLGADLVARPDLLERPDYAAKAAMWFWKRHNLNAYADRGEFKKVCAIINTGSEHGEPNHLAERTRSYDQARRVLSNGPKAPDEPDREDRGHDKASRNGLNRDGLPCINLAAVGQADETAAFVLASVIRKAGIGVTVTNGADNVYALAKAMRSERLGYRQLWVLGGPALNACGDYGDLANWPASPKTDYYDLAGKSLTGTCRRAAELVDEKTKKGIGQKFLQEMGMAEPDSTEAPIAAMILPREVSVAPEIRVRQRGEDRREDRQRHDEDEEDPGPRLEDYEPSDYEHHARNGGRHEGEHRRRGKDFEYREDARERREEPVDETGSKQDSSDKPASVTEQGNAVLSGSLIDVLSNNRALITWFAGAAVTGLVGSGIIVPEQSEAMTTSLVTIILVVLGLLSRQMTYGPVTVKKKYRKKRDDE
ncbi:MAG: hypothetical protein M3Q54_03140 [Actinomycetota bacterium]|nr:hypothetical protein [Actinomycetota bacterium]